MIVRLHASFEELVQKDEDSSEFWLARDLQELLGYAKWENFARVIDKAKTACQSSGHAPENHFLDVRKMVELGSGATRAVDDIALTRYACYLIAQNGDPSKEAMAFAQTYFAVQTRKQELTTQDRRKPRECGPSSRKIRRGEPTVCTASSSQNSKKDLWSAADKLRANSDLKASEYSTPVLGIIFLKFANNKYRLHEDGKSRKWAA